LAAWWATVNAASDMEQVAQGFSFLECPRWYGGRLFASDLYTHRVLAFGEDGTARTICELEDQPAGLGFAPDGSLMIVSMQRRKVLRWSDGELSEIADLREVTGFHCNDMVVDSMGRAYVGNMGWDVYREAQIRGADLVLVRPDGTPIVVASDLVFPNGMALAPDGSTLFVAETFASRITAFDVCHDGTLRNRRVWAAFTDRSFDTIAACLQAGVVLPDGIALDAEGALWVADAGRRGPIRVAEGGRILERVDTGESTVYAVALGGADRRTLYMCAGPPLLTIDPRTVHRASLLACRVRTPGI